MTAAQAVRLMVLAAFLFGVASGVRSCENREELHRQAHQACLSVPGRDYRGCIERWWAERRYSADG